MRELLKEEPAFNLLLQTGQVSGACAGQGAGLEGATGVGEEWWQNHRSSSGQPKEGAGACGSHRCDCNFPQEDDILCFARNSASLRFCQVLLAQKQFQETRELLQAALDVCGKRCAAHTWHAVHAGLPPRFVCRVCCLCCMAGASQLALRFAGAILLCSWADTWKQSVVCLCALKIPAGSALLSSPLPIRLPSSVSQLGRQVEEGRGPPAAV